MAGYSGTPLIKKLGIKPGQSICILNAPQGYDKTLGALPSGIVLRKRLGAEHSLDFIQFFTLQSRQLDGILPQLRRALRYDGSLWISWPKRTAQAKSEKLKSDLNENIIRDLGLQLGLVDVKVAAVDEIWSGLKFVYRLTERPKP
jgi:hypothetical protein